MRSRPPRSLAALQAPLIALGASSCIAVLDPDAYVTEGEGASSTTSTQSTGAGGATTATSGSTSTSTSTSSAGGGGGSSCDADLLTDPANCGACGWKCGPGVTGEGACVDGVCAAYRVEIPPTSYLAVIDDDIIRAGAEDPVEVDVRAIAFTTEEPRQVDVSTFGFTSAKIARTETTVAGSFIVSSPQAAGGGNPQPVLFCDPVALTSVQQDLVGDVMADTSPSSVAFAGDTLYWAFNADETHLRSVDAQACADGSCTLEAASGAWDAPETGVPATTPRPSSLRKQNLPGGGTRLWWTIHDFTEGSTATTCAYAWDVTSGSEAPVPCAVEDQQIFTLVAAGPNVFYSTDVGGEGLIHRIVPDGEGWASDKITISLQHPLEVDDSLLFAYSGSNEDKLKAAKPDSPTSYDLEEAGFVQLHAREKPVHLDATHPEYFVFTTCEGVDDFCTPANLPGQTWRLYRWRKPPVPPG